MPRPLGSLVFFFASVACHRADPGAAPPHRDAGVARPSASATPSATVEAPKPMPVPVPQPSLAPVVAPSSKPSAEAIDFEDGFDYGSGDPATAAAAAGPVDPPGLTANVAYAPYANARFGFSVDVPRPLKAMPAPDNGDGMQWRLGKEVAMTASGMNMAPEVGLMCANSKNVTAHTENKNSCWATGKRGGYIYWQRQRLVGDVMYSLELQYKEALNDAMAPIVKHVNGSWSP